MKQPAAKMKFSKVKTIIDLLILIVAILIPVLSGIFLVNPMPRSVFVLLKVRNLTVLSYDIDKVTLFLAGNNSKLY